jgi:hypothetical protein
VSGRVGAILGVLLLVAVLLFGLYVWGALSWAYSEGERAGILQKFSIKGWICKTYEGELAISIVPGVTPVIWTFSVRDESMAPQINAALGKRVVLHYREHALPVLRTRLAAAGEHVRVIRSARTRRS